LLVGALAWRHFRRDCATMSHMGMADMPVSTMPRGWAAGLLAVTL
jgi:hypothetical protein